MKAIILAAGVNKRLGGQIDVPKSLLPLKNSTILENQIDSLEKAGISKEDILIVVGHKKEMIQKIHTNTLFNPKYSELDNGYSVYLALKYLLDDKNLKDSEEIFILDGDLVYDSSLITDLVKFDKKNVLVNKPITYSLELKDEISLTGFGGKILKLFIPSKEKPLDPKYSKIPLQSYAGIVKLSKKTAAELYSRLSAFNEKWYTLPFPDLVLSNDFYSFVTPQNLKYCFDVDTVDDLKKLSNIK